MARNKPPRGPARSHAEPSPQKPISALRGRNASERRRSGPADDGHWLHGRHAVVAAIANPFREIRQVLITRDAQARLRDELDRAATARNSPVVNLQVVDRRDIDAAIGGGGVHQGIAAHVSPLPERDLSDIIVNDVDDMVVVILDQVTDPHNVGAILRSAEAFGAAAVIVTERNAPEETGTLAKAASGAIERIPLIRIVNLAREIDYLKSRGFWTLGLAGEAGQSLAAATPAGRTALILGSEGEGLRRLTREHCDLLVRLPMAGGTMPSLNVSNAAAVALYELCRSRLT